MAGDDDKPFFYANGVLTGFSPYDFTLVFQRRGIVGRMAAPQVGVQTRESDILDEIDVVMSPIHAKSLVALLIQSVVQFEKQNGAPIKIPEKEADILRQMIPAFAAFAK